MPVLAKWLPKVDVGAVVEGVKDNPFGLIALVVILLAAFALVSFSKARPKIQIPVFAFLFAGGAALIVWTAGVYSAAESLTAESFGPAQRYFGTERVPEADNPLYQEAIDISFDSAGRKVRAASVGDPKPSGKPASWDYTGYLKGEILALSYVNPSPDSFGIGSYILRNSGGDYFGSVVGVYCNEEKHTFEILECPVVLTSKRIDRCEAQKTFATLGQGCHPVSPDQTVLRELLSGAALSQAASCPAVPKGPALKCDP